MHRSASFQRGSSVLITLALLPVLGCSGSGGGPEAVPSALPAMVALAGPTTVGFAWGRLRARVELDPYNLTQRPITQSQYEECEHAGVCQQPAESACATEAYAALEGFDLDAGAAPALCVGSANARAYCKWIGGRLPTLAEWMNGARGAEPKRFAWGETLPSCEQNPRAAKAEVADPSEAGGAAYREPCHALSEQYKLKTGEHAAGAASTGVEDVLLLPAELIAYDESEQWSACSDREGACLIYGGSAGAIDSVTALSAAAAALEPSETGTKAAPAPASETGAKAAPAPVSDIPVPYAYAFRCVVGED